LFYDVRLDQIFFCFFVAYFYTRSKTLNFIR